MFKSSLSRRFYQDFLESYQSYSQSNFTSKENEAYVYVDSEGIMFLSEMVSQDGDEDGVFALSVDGSGYLQLLSTQES